MKYGFTGSRKGIELTKIKEVLDRFNLTKYDTIITGACVGIDAQVSKLAKEYECNQLVIVPFDQSKTDKSVFENIGVNDGVIYLTIGTDYRDRNELIVKNSDKLIAFWDGNKRSGTWMTMNIAKRKGIPMEIIRI